MPNNHIINGRFCTQRLSGVQRVARSLTQALDACVDEPASWRLAVPIGADLPPLHRLAVQQQGGPWLRGHAWEQTVMAAEARRGNLVLNIGGSGPWFGGAQVSWLHDAAVFDHPQAYRPAFVAWYRALFRHRARRGDRLITPSLHARDRLAFHLRVPSSRIDVLSHGGDHLDAVEADNQVCQRLGLHKDRYWLAVASGNPNKNLPRLERAWARAGSARWPLVVVGGHDARVFAGQGGTLPAQGLLRVPRASDSEIKALLQGARALLMPSLVEGFGLPALEALRCGCAVMAARAGALPEVCGDAAIYVDPHSEDEIAAAIDVLTHDEARVSWLREAGLRRAQPCTWERAARRLVRLLRAGSDA